MFDWLQRQVRSLWAPATGIDRYEVVPDELQGKLGAGQITRSQHDELTAFGFDEMEIVDDTYAGDIAPGQMTQWEYDQIQMAWLCMAANSDGKDTNKADNLGVTLDGEAADQQRFKEMLAAGITRSDIFREQFLAMGNDRSVNLTFDVSGDQSAKVDQFEGHDGLHGTRGIHGFDLDDLGVFPDQAPEEFPEAMTRGEMLLHGISEAYRGVKSTIADDPGFTDPRAPGVTLPPWYKRYQDAHDHAVAVENAYRVEQGQTEKRDDTKIYDTPAGTGLELGEHAELWNDDAADLFSIRYYDPTMTDKVKFRAPSK